MHAKKAQVAIFIIIGIAIVSIFIWFVVKPRLPASFGGAEINPSAFMRDCLKQDLARISDKIALQGGLFTPTHYAMHNGEQIQYLCYTSEDYKPCVVQQPLLVKKVSDELKAQVEPKARACMESLRARYEKQNYLVESSPRSINVSIIPGTIEILFNAPLTVSKESKQTFRQFSVKETSEIYDLLMTATSIIEFESTLGDSETTYYMQFYPDLKIEKFKNDDDTIYTLSNVITDDSFRFATRSLVWPRGYGIVQ